MTLPFFSPYRQFGRLHGWIAVCVSCLRILGKKKKEKKKNSTSNRFFILEMNVNNPRTSKHSHTHTHTHTHTQHRHENKQDKADNLFSLKQHSRLNHNADTEDRSSDHRDNGGYWLAGRGPSKRRRTTPLQITAAIYPYTANRAMSDGLHRQADLRKPMRGPFVSRWPWFFFFFFITPSTTTASQLIHFFFLRNSISELCETSSPLLAATKWGTDCVMLSWEERKRVTNRIEFHKRHKRGKGLSALTLARHRLGTLTLSFITGRQTSARWWGVDKSSTNTTGNKALFFGCKMF